MKKKGDTKPYDTRAKRLLSPAIPALLRLLGRLDRPDEWKAEPNEKPLVTHRHADFILKNSRTGDYIQVEFQTQNDSHILRRLFLYAAPYYHLHGVIPYQYVLHLGKKPARQPPVFNNGQYRVAIEIIDLKRIPAESLLDEPYPEIVVLALLCAHESPERLVEEILARLKAMVLDSEELRDYLSIMATLGNLRDLNSMIQQKSIRMGLHLDYTKTFIYDEGKAEGKAEGVYETTAVFVDALYADGERDISRIARLARLSEADVRAILEQNGKPT